MKSFTILMLVLVAVAPMGCYGGRSVGETVTVPAETKQQLMDRWNSTVANNPSPNDLGTGWDFYWPSFYEFPHPTYKGGSAIAYQEFAALLLTFLQTGDNFDYLASNELFDLRLGYAMADGSGKDAWSLRELVSDFSNYTAFGVEPATADGLKAIAAKIAALG